MRSRNNFTSVEVLGSDFLGEFVSKVWKVGKISSKGNFYGIKGAKS